MRQRNGHYNRFRPVVHVRWHPYKPIPAKFPPFELESKGKNAEEPRNRAEWAKAIAGVLFKRSEARSKEVKLANGEALPTGAEKILHDTLTVPDLASVEASFERTRLLIQQGPGVAAMAVDASTSIQAKNTLEKMMVHQLAAVHRAVMDQLAFAQSRPIRRRAHLFFRLYPPE
jgi:hypothetical protein